MTTLRFTLIAAPMLALLAACDTGTTDFSEFERLSDEFVGAPITPTATVNAMVGTAVYDGAVLLRMPTVNTTALEGDARVTVNFTTDIVTGTLNGFDGQVNGGPATAFNGALGLAGDINTARVNDIRTAVSGTLVGGGDRVNVAGIMDGNFLEGSSPFVADGLQLNLNSASTFNVNGGLNYAPGGGNSGITVLAERD